MTQYIITSEHVLNAAEMSGFFATPIILFDWLFCKDASSSQKFLPSVQQGRREWWEMAGKKRDTCKVLECSDPDLAKNVIICLSSSRSGNSLTQ